MAILSSPLFNAQQRLDLEDLNQLISGFKTDARLWVRQLFNTENMIIKGFQCDQSVGQTELNVDIISAGSTESATFILAGRRFDSTTGQIVESPSDFSWFTIESSQTNTESGSAIRLTAEIPTTFRPLRGTTRLYAYVRLLNSQGTPITKAFWDPSANSGAGAEFNQSVNTANDLAIAIEVVNAPITNTADLLGRIPLCTLSVDAGGNIRSVVDTRALFFKKDADFAFTTDAKLNVNNAIEDLTSAEVSGISPNRANKLDYRLGEEVYFVDLLATTPAAQSTQDSGQAESVYTMAATPQDILLRGKIINPGASDTSNIQLQIDNLRDGTSERNLITTNENWADAIKPRSTLIVGLESGAVRMLETLTNRFDINDKNITSFYKMFQSLETEIARIKGTDYWYDSPLGSIHDTLRQINSVIIGEEPNAIYNWDGNNLAITTNPAKSFIVTVIDFSTITTGSTITITNEAMSSTIVVTAGTTNTSGTFIAQTNNDTTARNIANAFRRQSSSLLSTVSGAEATISVLIANEAVIGTVATSAAAAQLTVGQITDATSLQVAAVRIFGNRSKFILERHDGTSNGAIPIMERNVAYIKLPDLDSPTFDDTQTYSYAGFRTFTDTTAFINTDIYNDDATNVPQASNSFTGRILVIPIEDYVDDGRNFWIAFHEDSGANNLFVRDIGQIGRNELVPIGEGVSNQTLAYIGAPNENTATPNYPNVSGIGAPTGGGVFTDSSTKSNINTSIITQGENLTLAVNDLNTVATSVKDSVIQDKDMKLIGGGTVLWSLAGNATDGTGVLTFSGNLFLQVPGLTNARNQITSGITFTGSSGVFSDQVAFISVNRSGSTAQSHSVTVVNTSSFTPSRDNIVIARRLGEDIWVGVNGSMRFSAGESAPLDGVLSLLGFTSNTVPLALKLAPMNAITGGIGLSVADGTQTFNVDSGGGMQTLNLTIAGEDGSSRVLRFPGAILNFTNGNITNADGTRWLNRAENAAGTEFTPATLTAGQEVWYAISLEFDKVIVAADKVGTLITDDDIGKILGRIVVSNGTPAATNMAVSAAFGGSLPVGQLKVSRNMSGLIAVVGADIIQLGASGGGGGGGAGDASQSINNFINRLNLSTFNYFTPVVSSVFSTRLQIDETNSGGGGEALVIGNNGFQIPANIALQTLQLIDQEYLAENIDGIQLVEVEGDWGIDNDGTQRIDPNAIWSIRKQTTESFVPVTSAISATVAGYIENVTTPTLRGVNLTNLAVNAANANIFFSENHGLETGQRVTFTLGNITIQDPSNTGSNGDATTSYYVHRLSSQAFSLYGSRVLADAGGTRVTITSITTPIGVAANLPAGVLPRIGITNAVRATYMFPNTLTTPSNLNIELRIVGDSNQGLRETEVIEGLLVGFAMFYDQDGADVDSVPRTLDNVAEILRSNHLSNTETTTAGYGVAGRGVTLLNNAATPVNTEIALDANNNITIGTDGTFVTPITTNGATTGQILIADANGNFSPATGGGSITIPTPGETVFSALIEGSTGAASIISENVNFIQSIAGPNTLGTGVYAITWVPGFFTQTPTVTGNTNNGSPELIDTSGLTTTGVTINSHSRGTGLANADFSMVVTRQGTDYAAARAITTTITF